MNGTLTLEYAGRGYTATTFSRGFLFGKMASISLRIVLDNGAEHSAYWIGRESERTTREQGILQEGLRELGIL